MLVPNFGFAVCSIITEEHFVFLVQHRGKVAMANGWICILSHMHPCPQKQIFDLYIFWMERYFTGSFLKFFWGKLDFLYK